MSDSAVLEAPAAPGTSRTYATIVVVGGGCYGSYYVRQLLRARAARALAFDRILVVDRDTGCRVARETSDAGVTVRQAEWASFFDEYLGDGALRREDAIVPSPLMPHLMFDWLVRRAAARWPGRSVERRALPRAPHTPWERAMPSGTHVVSFAEWTCPVNCVEPAMCPVIKGPRTWSMPVAMRAFVAAENRAGRSLAGPVIFHCEHRAYGVGMFETAAVLDADALVAREAAAGSVNVLVATASHCHGALDVLHIGPSGHAN